MIFVYQNCVRASQEAQTQNPPFGINDLHIAAHARSEGLVLVSNSLKEFERVAGLRMENWVEQYPFSACYPFGHPDATAQVTA